MAVFLKPFADYPNTVLGLGTYGIKKNETSLQVLTAETENGISSKWLHEKLLPNILRWAKFVPIKNSICSLSLVPVDEYCHLYNSLKRKHSNYIKQIWTESTDPQKFIFEDIAIATYLILLWKKPQRYVDLGCGNGLLVYLLNSENHHGVGIDVRARKIWEKFPPTTKLEVRTLTPSESSLFPEADWLIGNHSDELTPWIPVLAARSSYKCNFFILPCCAFDFSGQKYSRTNTSQSVYQNYIEYLKTLSMDFGFNIKIDKLKIPSTKRICVVSDGRVYSEEEKDDYVKKISEYIKYRVDGRKVNEEVIRKTSWIENFKPRSNVIEVRNCTKVEKDIVDQILDITVEILLMNRLSDNKEWDCGTPTCLGDIAKRIPQEHLQHLKKEHGGLQTLLRNNHQLFLIENGTIRFRKPVNREKDSVPVWKKRPCWFYYNHPDSCPLENEYCSFIH